MTIKLKRVELSNIRSHKHVIFEPEDEGITAISGPNGTGKSTIVDSIAWVLYGTKPQGVSKVSAIYREGAVFGTDRCFASVELIVDNQTIKVERRMVNKGGAVECEVWEVVKNDDGSVEYKQAAGPAVSHSEPYIRKRLKMDEKGFLSAILVQQKQVDQLISSSPRERAQVIEKLTGISSITAALVESRQDSNSLKKIASLSSIDEEGLTKLKEDRSSLEGSIVTQSAIVRKAKDEASVLKIDGIALREKVTEESQKIEDAEDLRQQLTVIITKLESYDDELERLTEERKGKRGELSLLSSGTSLKEIEPKVNKLKKDLRQKELLSEKITSELKDNRSKLESYSSIIELANHKTIDAASSAKDLILDKIKETSDAISEEKANGLSANSEIQKLSKAISVLTEGEGTCPTCLQNVEDVTSAVSILNKEINILTELRESTKSRILEHRKVEDESRTTLVTLNTLIEAFNQSTIVSDSINASTANYAIASSDVVALETELKAVEKIYNEAKRHGETKKDYDRLLARSKTVSNEVESLTSRKAKIEDEIRDSGTITSAALAKLRKQLDEARMLHNKTSMFYSESRGELNLSKERLKHLHEKIANHEEEVERYKSLLKSVEVATAATNLIEEFREERIRNSIPVIEVYASDLLSRFTEGKFTRLKIDGKFNTSVILANGTERAVGLLSGGELSAASMALRLAISMLLNSGSSTNLIILDEVLVSQDAGRAELILSTVKDVCKGQVVLIAHNDSIDGIADKVVELDAN